VDPLAVEEWIRGHVEPAGTIETVRERPWATVLRVPLAGGVAWFKACAPVRAFEPRLTAELHARWPDRVAEVLAYMRLQAALPQEEQPLFNVDFSAVLRRAVALTGAERRPR
jgi:hypothetical protein